MRIVSSIFCLATLAALGCGKSNNPNEAAFPGAPGSSVPAPTSTEKSAPGGMPRGDGSGLPSNYPGVETYSKSAANEQGKEPAPEAEKKGSEPAANPAELPAEPFQTAEPPAKQASPEP